MKYTGVSLVETDYIMISLYTDIMFDFLFLLCPSYLIDLLVTFRTFLIFTNGSVCILLCPFFSCL